MFSFEAFDCIIRFANDAEFSRDSKRWAVHMEAIQLAIFWDYQEFIDVVESQLVDQLNLLTLTDLSALARRHPKDLRKLHEACENFTKSLEDRRHIIRWTRCPIDNHPNHHLLSCRRPKDESDSDWD